tara:strand:- start:119 stop:616 length:498 start_codon:yes stop_codon:yes gene_type:complete
MLRLFFDKHSRSNVWEKVYKEKPGDFNSRITKVYEVISITTAIMSGLSVTFMNKNAEHNIIILQVISTIALCISLFTLIFSIIIITMINATETKNYLLFINDWSGTFIFPTIGVIVSSMLTLVSLFLYIPYHISVYIAPISTIVIISLLWFYCKIRTSVFNYSLS